jgi:hypothetical protein
MAARPQAIGGLACPRELDASELARLHPKNNWGSKVCFGYRYQKFFGHDAILVSISDKQAASRSQVIPGPVTPAQA